jgi:hypothetical protein
MLFLSNLCLVGSSGGNLNTARDGMYGGAGTQTAGLVTGGRDASVAVNESYDGGQNYLI